MQLVVEPEVSGLDDPVVDTMSFTQESLQTYKQNFGFVFDSNLKSVSFSDMQEGHRYLVSAGPFVVRIFVSSLCDFSNVISCVPEAVAGTDRKQAN